MGERRVDARVIGPGLPGHLKVDIGGMDHEIPVEQLPPALCTPNSRFIAVIDRRELVRVENSKQQWQDIRDRIRIVLNTDWDPIRVAGIVEDEYDGYIAGIYRMLQRGSSPEELAAHLLRIETVSMGLPGLPVEHCLQIARRLRELNRGSDS